MKVSKTFALIIVTTVHFVTTVFFFFFSAGLVIAAFDGKVPLASYRITETIYKILSFPVIWADNHIHLGPTFFPGIAYWLLYIFNSFLWAWVIVNGFIWLRKNKF